MISSTHFQKDLLIWYGRKGRQLPWRQVRDPYLIWVSEIIFQQTRIAQGTKYYFSFTENFPSVASLALAQEDEVLKVWQGLGYYRRALNMIKTAKIVHFEHHDKSPHSYDGLLKLPGIGPYTAAAISSVCYDELQAVVDGNVIRVLSRMNGIKQSYTDAIGKKKIDELAQNLISSARPGDYNQAIMDFGALHCTASNPKCWECPFENTCIAKAQGLQDTLPVKKKKAAKKNRHFYYMILKDQDGIIMEKRLGDDIWKGLYQFPLYEGSSRASRAVIAKHLKENDIHVHHTDIVKFSTPRSQTLTHQIINFHFYWVKNWKIGRNNLNFEAFSQEKALKLPMPKTLNCFFTNNDLLLEQNR